MASDRSSQLFTSHFSIPYSSLSSLNTLDIHVPTTPSTSPAYWIIFIHGGAFRDPLITSHSLLPSIPFLLSSPHRSRHISALCSINYRLSPYPSHPTHPSHASDPARNALWPQHLHDVATAINFLSSHTHPALPLLHPEGRYILAGHSVGATLAFAYALSDLGNKKPRSVVGVEGIYDFVALRDAHLAYREVYEGFIAGALGPEEKGGGRGWSKADIAGAVRGRKREEEEEEEEEERRRWGVVLGWSKGDELVEVGQMEGMQGALRGAGWNDKGEGKRNVRIVELKGGHDEIWEKGEEMARAIEGGLELCLETDG